jgi:DNA-binding NarL/FixJ family response regulator
VIRVLLVDDQSLVRTGFRMILEETADITVVGEAADGCDALALAGRTRPDVVLMDVRMAGMDGIQATRLLRDGAGPDDPPRVIILTTFDLHEYVFAGLQAGASGFLLKDTLAADLLAAVRVVAAGQAVAAPTVTRRLIEHFVGRAPAPPRDDAPLEALTMRGARGPHADRAGAVQQRDRRDPGAVGGHGQDPHQPHLGQARPARPRPGGHPRVPDRPGHRRHGLRTAAGPHAVDHGGCQP